MPGPGGATSESIPARLSNGEFVVNARATAKNLDLPAALNAGRLPGFADGGLVMAPKLTMPGGAPTAGSQNVNLAPSITVSVEGGSNGADADREMGERVGKQVETVLRRIVADELMTQMRPGGMMSQITNVTSVREAA